MGGVSVRGGKSELESSSGWLTTEALRCAGLQHCGSLLNPMKATGISRGGGPGDPSKKKKKKKKIKQKAEKKKD